MAKKQDSWEVYLRRQLQDPEFKKEFDKALKESGTTLEEILNDQSELISDEKAKRRLQYAKKHRDHE